MLNLKFFLGIFAILATVANSQIFQHNSLLIERFKNWVDTHKIQASDDNHLVHIFENWLDNDKFIELTNTKNLSYTLGHNAYSGMNSDEFAEFMGFEANADLLIQESEYLDGYLRGSIHDIAQENILDLDLNLENLPTTVDWREKGAVTGVKNQQNCGSCWSFSTTGALEGIYAISRGNLVSFSEQQLVDCDNGITKNHGCNGGLMDTAFSFISSNGGLCSESDYPYVSGTSQKAESCQTSCKVVSGSKISKYVDIPANSDNAMMTALVQQPVSVAIEADQKSFQMYKSGVFTATCGTNLDHGVLLVGYGSQSGLDYYILKNSWGVDSWGMNGYLLLGRGNDPATGKPYNNGAGQCGVLGMASYPLL